MKRILSLAICVLLMFSIIGCSNNQTNESDDNLYNNAINVLDEFKDKKEVQDFLEAYKLLTTLPDNEKQFIEQLHEANAIYAKYDMELDKGDYYLGKSGTFAISEESIKEYKSKAAYHDAYDLLEKLIYPILFERYGSDAHRIEELKSTSVINAIESTNLFSFKEENERFDTTKKEYQFNGDAKVNYEVTYHPNGLVESVTVPIAISGNPFSDNDYTSFFEYDLEQQKAFAGNRFIEMQSSFDSFACGSEVLSLIYDADELKIIANYIHSLSKDDIWERNILESDNTTTYMSAMVYFSFRDTNVCINYGLNSIKLFITGKNYINTLSHKWHTVWLGFCHKSYSEDTVNDYIDYLNNNVEKNSEIEDYSYDLDLNADKFKTNANGNYTDESGTMNNDHLNDVQQSIPVEISMSEKVTVSGIIEENDTVFPSYRLRLTTKLSFIFDEYIGEKVFECEYLYFYDDPELNQYPLADFVGESCEVTALLEDYRGGDELFLLNPIITMN